MFQIFGKENQTCGLIIYEGSFTKKHFETPYFILHLVRGKLKVQIHGFDKTIQDQGIMVCGTDDIQIESIDQETYLIIYQLSNKLLNTHSNKSTIQLETKIIDVEETSGRLLMDKLNDIIHYIRQNKGQMDFHLSALSLETLQILVNNFSVKRFFQNSSSNECIFDILLYIENHYSSVITLDDISDRFDFSPAYFSRYFKKKTGSNFLEYLTYYRLEQATKSIIDSSLKISEIATQKGFSNINSFNKKFKEKYGCTPKEYRKKFSQDEGNLAKNTINNQIEHIPDQVMLQTNVQHFKVFPSQSSEINRWPWKNIINIGSAEDLLRVDLRKHMTYLKENLRFKYVRFWNLFTKNMNMDPSITTKYNFEKIDSVLDFIVSEEMCPFIELRYKIRRIHRSVRETLILENEDFKFILNSTEWFDMINQFMKHVNNRYGRKEVNQWMFEFSFEHYQNEKELDELISHYKKTYQTIRKSNSFVKIGGPGTMAQNDEFFNYKRNLHYFNQQRVTFDFISCLIYPYQVRAGGEKKSVRVENDDFLENIVSELKEVVEESPYQKKEIIITEWNNTISNRNVINDSLFKGSYLIKNFASIMDKVDGIAYWVGSDLFSEFIDSRDVLHGGAGLIAKGGIPKPVFHAFRFMNFLNDHILLNKKGLIVSKDEDERYGIILHNYISPNIKYFLIGEDEIEISDLNKLFSNDKSRNIELIFYFKPGKNFEIKSFKVNQEYGNIISGWKDIGYRSSLSSKDLEYLMMVSVPKITIKQVSSDLNGYLVLNECLVPNEFTYITISPMEE